MQHRVCGDLLHLLVEYLNPDDRAYVSGDEAAIHNLQEYGAREGLTDILARADDPFQLLGCATVRAARFLVHARRVWPRELTAVKSIDVLCFLRRKGFWYHDALYLSLAKSGRVDILRFAVANGPPITDRRELLRSALCGGSLESVKFVHEHLDVAWTASSMSHAAQSGNVHVLRYARENGCNWHADALFCAIYSGNLACVKYIHTETRLPWWPEQVTSVICMGHLEVLKYMLDCGHVLAPTACNYAARTGRLDILEFVLARGCEWNAATCSGAAPHFAMLVWLHERGCPWDEETCASAARGGALQSLRYAHEHGCPWDEGTCLSAVQCGRLEVLKYAHEHGCPLTTQTVSSVLYTAHDDMCDYLVDNNCPWDPFLYVLAIRQKKWQFITRALAKGFPADAATSAEAAGWSLRVLRQFHEAGCPWDYRTYLHAVIENNIDCFIYAHEHGCPMSQDVLDFIHTNDDPVFVRYARKHFASK